jgi:hypothetical protein
MFATLIKRFGGCQHYVHNNKSSIVKRKDPGSNPYRKLGKHSNAYICDYLLNMHCLHDFETRHTDTGRAFTLRAGANPTTLSYNASVVKIYDATNSMARFLE